jgi:iron complex outermembrane recepter protein
MGFVSNLRISMAVCALNCCAAVAFGQTAITEASSPLEEIVVTANKRAERLQDVPASVLAITSEQLKTQNIRNFDDLIDIAPNLTITKTSQPGNNSINMRGVGTYSLSIASQTSVAVVVDDVPQSIQAEAFSHLVGVQQIEVLRGPQSTLFGKSADAGVISITTAQPTDHFSTEGSVMATSDNEQEVQAAVSGPITDQLKARLTVNDSHYRGQIFNVTTRNWVDGDSDRTARLNLLWQPTTELSVSLIPYYTNTIASCCAVVLSRITPGVTFPSTSKTLVPLSQAYPGIAPRADNTEISQSVDARGNALDYGTGLKADYNFANGYSLISITSFDHYELDDLQSTDQSAYNFALLNPLLPKGGSANGGYFKVKNYTEEIRLTSPGASRFRYVAGAFWSDTRAQRLFVRGSDVLGTFNGQPPLATSSPYSFYDAFDTIETAALFGQATWDLTDRLSLVGGARFEHEENSYRFYDIGNDVVYGAPRCSTVTPSRLAGDTCNNTNATTGKAAIQYRFTPDFMVFADWASGFKGEAYDLTSSMTVRTPVKGGAFNGLPNADVIVAQQPIAAETSRNYEVGFKGQFFDRRLTWNTTVFYEEFHNYQSSREDPVTQLKELQSVPLVTTKGVETELAAQPLAGLIFTASGAYDIAKSNTFPGAACFASQTVAQGCVNSVQDLSGMTLSNAPRWSGYLNGEYNFHLVGDFSGFVDLNYRYQSKVWFNTSLDPNSIQSGYGLMNLSVGTKTDHWKVAVFVNNVFDKQYALERGSQTLLNVNPYGGKAGPITNATFWVPGRDAFRYAGVRFDFNF